eukprot:Gb_03170 [translate_table: standard]
MQILLDRRQIAAHPDLCICGIQLRNVHISSEHPIKASNL